MSVDTTAATRSSGSDSDMSSCSNWSVLDDSDNNTRYERKIRMGGKKIKTQSKTKVKPPKAKKKFDIEDEIFMMEEVLSQSGSEGSLHLALDPKEDGSEPFEEILPEPQHVRKTDSVELYYKRKNKEHLQGSRIRNISIMNLMGLLFLMTSFSWITAMFGTHYLAKTNAVVANENLFAKITDDMKHSDNVNGLSLQSRNDLPLKAPEKPTVVILPLGDMKDANITKLEKAETVQPHFHNDGKVTYGPMTFKDYLSKQKTKLEDMKASAHEASNTRTKDAESLNKVVADILKKSESKCDGKFKCCKIKKRLDLSKQCKVTDMPKEDVIAKYTDKPKEQNSVAVAKKGEPQDKIEPMQGPKLNFKENKIDNIINNFDKYLKKQSLSTPKEKKSDKLLPRPLKDNRALHKVTKTNNFFKQGLANYKLFNFRKFKETIYFRIAVCLVLDFVLVVTMRKLGIAFIGSFKSFLSKPERPKLEVTTINSEVGEVKRADMFKILPFHRTKARVIVKKSKKQERVEKGMFSMERKVPEVDNPSDFYLFMLNLRLKGLDRNLKEREENSPARFKIRRYSTEFKQSLIKQLSTIYKDTVRSDKLRDELVFCIMKIYECKFEYIPISTISTNEALDRLDKFKTLLVDYYRYRDNPLVNTKYLKNATAKQKENLAHILDLMLEDQKLGSAQTKSDCTFSADSSNTFKYQSTVEELYPKPPVTTKSSGNMFKTATAANSINDPGYYMRERFNLLAKFWKLKQAYFSKRIQICNMLKEKLSDTSIAEHEGANILDGIINNAITNSTCTLKPPKDPVSQGRQTDAFNVSEDVISEVVSNVQKVFKTEVGLKADANPPMCKKICRVNNELYRELFERKAQAIQEKDFSKGRMPLVKTSEMNAAKISLSKPYQVVRDPRFHKKL